MKRTLLPFLLVTLVSATALVRAQPPSDTTRLNETWLRVPERFASFYGDQKIPLYLPPGFEVTVFYAGLVRPRFLAWSPEGVLHVADMEGNAIIALPDADRDGVADTAIVVAAPVDSAHSIAFYGGDLYVAEPSRVRRFRDTDHDGIYETPEPFIDGINAVGPYNHFTRTIVFDTIGGHIYLSVGASCNVCREQAPERGAILRFDLDGSGRTVMATGLRNAIGLTIDRETGDLWAANADRDHLGDDAPREMVTRIEEGAFYGWPFAYGEREWVHDFHAAPEYTELLPITHEDSERVASMRVADLLIPAHSTPMGIVFPHDSLLPSEYLESAFVALHGSSSGGRSTPVGYKVIRIFRDDMTGAWQSEDFLKGFLTDSTEYRFWGRPCGIVSDGAGAFYLSSDGGIRAIYRIARTPSVSVPDESSPSAGLTVRVAPNPTVGGAQTFRYRLPEEGRVTLTIHDAEGRQVALLRAGEMEGMGEHEVSWNREPGGSVAGAYFYRVVVTGVSGREYRADGMVVGM